MEIKEYVALEKEKIAAKVASFVSKPTLCIVTVGHDPASESYVRGKKKDAAAVGINVIHQRFEDAIKESELIEYLDSVNKDPSVHGIIVQLPLPKSISEERVSNAVDPSKDVDGFSLLSPFEPCTPKGIVDYLTNEGYPFAGANAVVFGRSRIVGKPLARLLLRKNCNVTVLHSRTKEEDRVFYISHADLLIAATGRKGLLDSHYSYKPTAYLIDVGINRDETGHLCGDAEPGLPVAYQSPVPGGVGLLTRVSLLKNVLEAYEHGLSHR